MRKYAYILWHAQTPKIVGNHAVNIIEGDTITLRQYTYHGNVIFAVSPELRVAVADNCGWDTVSTNAAINQYIALARADGYEVRWGDDKRFSLYSETLK